jgi:VWFA-related protein
MRRRSSGLVLLPLAIVSIAALGQTAKTSEEAAPVARMYPAYQDQWPLIGLDVNVIDRVGEPVRGITLAQLEVLDDGNAAKDVTLTPVTGPQSICLLVDTSGSTYLQRNLVNNEIVRFIQDLPAGDELCGMEFSVKPRLDLPLTTDRSKMYAWVSYLNSLGGTALLDGLRGAEAELTHAKFPRRAIVLIGDGDDNVSSWSIRNALNSFHAPGVPVLYALVNQVNSGELKAADADRLSELVSESGGLEFLVKNEQDGQEVVTRLVRAMEGRYWLEFTARSQVADGKFHRVNVQLNKGLQKQKMKVAFVHGYDATTGQ